MTCALIESNAEADKGITDRLVADAEHLMEREMGRPSGYIMACFESVEALSFGGSDLPGAYVQIEQIYDLQPRQLQNVVEGLTSLISQELGIDAGRIYIVFETVKPTNWGFNGSTF